MALIYKITNLINQKVYIGKTNHLNIQERWKEHLSDYTRTHKNKRPLYEAMSKYGIQNFSIEEIEQGLTDKEACEREKFWIEYFNSYVGFDNSNGYNATLGGDGKILFDYDKIAGRLKDYPYAIQVAKEFDCHPDTVKQVAQIYHITLKVLTLEQKKKQIARLDKITEEVLQVFDSLQDAMKWCVENGYCATCGSGPASHISDAAKGKRRTAYQFKWKFI